MMYIYKDIYTYMYISAECVACGQLSENQHIKTPCVQLYAPVNGLNKVMCVHTKVDVHCTCICMQDGRSIGLQDLFSEWLDVEEICGYCDRYIVNVYFTICWREGGRQP